MKVRQNLQATQEGRWQVRGWIGLSLVFGMVLAGCNSSSEPPPSEMPPTSGAQQAVQPLQSCEPCHIRQYRESIQSVKSGYRAISPTLNALELAGNFLAQGAFEQRLIETNLRPTYATPTPPDMLEFDTEVRTGPNMISAEQYQNRNQIRSAFCIGCHDGAILLEGEDSNSLDSREVPEWQGRLVDHDNSPTTLSVIENVRPLRDYHFVDENREQVLPLPYPDRVGRLPQPPGTFFPSRGAQGVLCDHCHNVQGPDLPRSLQGDGFANVAQEIEPTRIKVGPFDDAVPVGPLPNDLVDAPFMDTQQQFHSSSSNPDRINYLRSSEFCIACHDVRVPNRDLITVEGDDDPDTPPPHFRLENLGTEWATQPYAFADHASNPFRQGSAQPVGFPVGVVRCQDCHMSLFPYGGNATYAVRDEDRDTPVSFEVTSPLPGQFPTNSAADPIVADLDVTGTGVPVPQDRSVVTHYLTGVDVPLVYTNCEESGRGAACVGELEERLGADRPPVNLEGEDEYGVPLSLQRRRADLLKAATRIFLDETDDTAELGHTFHARVTAIAFTGHNFPSGFSQERTTWIELTVSAPATFSGASANICNNSQFIRVGTESQFCTPDGEFILYQSGYRVDKPHPETGEDLPDRRLDDEDLEHLNAVVNPFNHNNEIFEEGPDNGPVDRIFFGAPQGLVLFRNELLRIYGPDCLPLVGATPDQQMIRERLPEQRDTCPPDMAATQIPPSNRRHPRTGELLTHVLEEETFSAGAANTVDNWRALPPLDPKTFVYEIELPSQEELTPLGITLVGPLHVRANIHFLHFPPLFLRFLARVSGDAPYALPPETDDPDQPYTRVRNFDLMPQNGYTNAVGLRGPGNLDFGLFDEKRIDDLLVNVEDIATAERCVPIVGGAPCPAQSRTAQAGRSTQTTAQR